MIEYYQNTCRLYIGKFIGRFIIKQTLFNNKPAYKFTYIVEQGTCLLNYLSNGVVLSTEISVKWDRLLAILHIEGNPSLDIVKCVMSYEPISSRISLSLFLVIWAVEKNQSW